MFEKFSNFWNDNGFEIALGLCIAFLIIYGLYRFVTRKSGNWDTFNSIHSSLKTSNTNPNNNPNTPFNGKRKPPKESKGEIECKRVLERIFNKPFNKIRPNFLNNPVTGGEFNLEIDCYNSDLRLGIEYSGRQHYEYIPFFHKNKEAFYNQKYRDELKRRICKDNNINLIEVPYTVRIEHIENFLVNELRKNGYLI